MLKEVEVEPEKAEQLCECMDVCVLHYFPIVMRCPLQVITTAMFIIHPASALSCVATESLDDI